MQSYSAHSILTSGFSLVKAKQKRLLHLSEFWPHYKGFIKLQWRGSQCSSTEHGNHARHTVAQLVVNNWETIWLCLDRGICGVWE